MGNPIHGEPTEPSAEQIRVAGEIGHGLSQLFRVSARAKARMCATGEIADWSTFVLLGPLMEMGPLRSSALAEAAHVDPSRASRMVAHLIDLGYAERQADPADGRASIIVVTDAGREAFGRVRGQRDRYLADVLADWPEEDRKSLAVLMERLAAALAADEHAKSAEQAHSAPEPNGQAHNGHADTARATMEHA